MPANIEIKARVRDLTGLKESVLRLSNALPLTITQEDTFYNSPHGRLKLRITGSSSAQLIYYDRPDTAAPKRSDYFIFETGDPANLGAILSAAFGIRGIVRKTRHLYLVGQTRIHLDEVADLGSFVELEVVLTPEQTNAEGEIILRKLMAQLGISNDELIQGAYLDMLEAKSL